MTEIQLEINLSNGTILRGPEVLSLGTGGRDVEGPHIIKRDDWYYLLAAEGGTGQGHMITMFRSKTLWGPFDSVPVNPLFTNRDRAEEPLQNIGHADLFQDARGNWWLTCLGTRPATVGHVQITTIGRETLLYPVNWSGDWPVIYNGIPTQTVDLANFPHHALTLDEQKFEPFIDSFTSETLNPEWVTLRDSLGEHLHLTPGQLTLTGSDLTLSDLGTPSFLALRQTEHRERLTIDIDTENTVISTGSFGIAVTINTEHYGALMIEKNNDGYCIFKVAQILDIAIKEVIAHLSTLPSQLSLEHGLDFKRFTAKTETETVTFDLHAQHFSNEAIAALNTGDFVGLYVLNDAKVSMITAKREALI